MSAYLIDADEIGLIAAFAVTYQCTKYGCCYGLGLEDAKSVAECLAKANLYSVEHKYPDVQDAAKSFLGISSQQYLADCVWAANKHDSRSRSVREMAERVSTYVYQSCEPDNWHQSTAFKIITVVREELLKLLVENKTHWRQATRM